MIANKNILRNKYEFCRKNITNTYLNFSVFFFVYEGNIFEVKKILENG